MKWYDKYLSIFEKPFDSIPKNTINEIRDKIRFINSDAPVASVVVIAYNEEKRLPACLWSLSNNKCKYPVEIIGIDNNSSDRTAEVYSTLGVRFFKEERKGPGYARNRGLAEAKGKILICIDSDTIYPEQYLEIMIDSFNKPGVVAVSSLYSFIPDKQFPVYKLFFYELLRDIHIFLLSFQSPERCIRGSVFAHNTALGREIGYRVNIKRGEDGSLAYALKDFGKIRFIRNRKARPVTSTLAIKSDGSLLNAFRKRAATAMSGFRKYFVQAKGELKDQDSNIIKD
ncbi:glycosyltransferase family 2 protein [Bacteroidales bacterium]